MKNKIEELIKSKMNISEISIADFSNNHKNHPGNSGEQLVDQSSVAESSFPLIPNDAKHQRKPGHRNNKKCCYGYHLDLRM